MSRSRALAVLACIVALGARAAVPGSLHAAPAAPEPHERTIVAFGDSLTAGFGVAPDEAYPARLAKALAERGYDYRVVNAGVSGDTTAGALRRLDWALRAKPDVVIVALGANDGLRGQSPLTMRDNLEAIVRRFQRAGARVLLAGMLLPPNYGEERARAFARVFPEVAKRTRVPLMPFLLEGIAADPHLNQADGIHPNAEGHRIIAEHVLTYLVPLLSRSPVRPASRPANQDAPAPRPAR